MTSLDLQQNANYDTANSSNHYATPDFSDITDIADFSDWQVYSDDAPLIEPGQVVYCEDDFSRGYNQYTAVYLGWYEDFHPGETSPFWGEAQAGIERLVVMNLSNGSYDYPLPEFTRHESQVNINHAITAKMD